MDVAIILVPYDSALRERRMGAGPWRMLDAGLADRLRAAGHRVRILQVAPRIRPHAEIRTAFELMERIAEAVRVARQAGRFPLVLAGNCNSAAGTVSGLDGVGVCWLDAHGDFNTPETTIGGFLDGMALSMLTGRCWRQLTSTIPGFAAVPDEHVILLGARDLDPQEAELLSRARLHHLPSAGARDGRIEAALDALARRVRGLYLHIDLDVLDPSEGRANSFAAAGGLSRADLRRVVASARARFDLRGAALTAYDPECDPDGRICERAIEAAEWIVADGAGAPQPFSSLMAERPS